MIKEQFFKSLVRGTGEACLLMQRHPHIDFSALILKGAIRNYALDQQAEGSRAHYIYQLVKKSRQRQQLTKRILDKLKSEKKDDHGLHQLSDLAVFFHKEGNHEALKSLYRRIEKNNLPGYEAACESQLVEIDGMQGMLKVAEVKGKWLMSDEGHYEDSWRADELQRKNKSINVYAELEKAGKENEFIAAYYRAIIAHKWKKLKRRKTRIKFSYEDVMQAMQDKRFRYISKPRADDLTEMEVRQLADEFLSEKNMAKKVNFLRFFRNRKFPYGIEPILKIAQGRVLHKNRALEHACESLRYFTDERIRNLALHKIKATKYPSIYLNLLVSNYNEGDDILLKELVDGATNFDAVHSLVYGFIEIYEANPTPACKTPLEAIYDRMNCGLHRLDILNILHQNGVLSIKIFKEIRYDCNEDIRALYRKIKKQKLSNTSSSLP